MEFLINGVVIGRKTEYGNKIRFSYGSYENKPMDYE